MVAEIPDTQHPRTAQDKQEDQHDKVSRAGHEVQSSLLRDLSLSEARAQQHAAACQQELAETMTRLLHVHDLHEQVAHADTMEQS